MALLLLGLAASALGALQLTAPADDRPIDPGQAACACGGIVTTVVLIFLDTSSAAIGAFLALIGGLAVIVGGLLMAARAGAAAGPRTPAPPTAEGLGPPSPPARAAAPPPPAGGIAAPPADGGIVPSPPVGGEGPPPPGFYPDPRREARLRYWDGADWTEQARD